MMSPPTIPLWTIRDPALRSVAGSIVAARVAVTGLVTLALSAAFAQAITVTTTFDNLFANNNSNNLINSPYQSGDFNLVAGNLFFRGTRSIYYPGSGALYTGDGGSQVMTITHAGGLFNLQGFAIHSQLGEFGQFRLIVTDEAGALHASSTFSLGTYDEPALLQLFGGQAFFNDITSVRFENTTGEGIVLDNIYAIPEPSTALLAALSILLIGARNSSRLKLPPSTRSSSSPLLSPVKNISKS